MSSVAPLSAASGQAVAKFLEEQPIFINRGKKKRITKKIRAFLLKKYSDNFCELCGKNGSAMKVTNITSVSCQLHLKGYTTRLEVNVPEVLQGGLTAVVKERITCICMRALSSPESVMDSVAAAALRLVDRYNIYESAIL